MTTVVVAFPGVVLTDPTNPTVSLRATFTERKQTSTLDGAVRFYAGGRRRIITTAKRSLDIPLTLPTLSDADLATLDGWRGRLLLLRDGAGRRVFGAFLSLDITDWVASSPVLHEVSLTFQQVTYVEGV